LYSGALGAEEPLAGTLQPMDTRPLGMGGALLAAPSGTSGIYLNPASLPMMPIYHFGGNYRYTGDEQQHGGSITIVDSVTTVVAAGLAFDYGRISEPHFDHQSFDGRLALAGQAGNIFYFGATGRYLHLEQNIDGKKWGPAGRAALPASGSAQVDGFTLDVGLALMLGEVVTLGAVGYNLVPTESMFAPLQLGSGISIRLFDMLMLEGDAVVDFSSHRETSADIRFGAEVFIAGTFAIRAGYDYDTHHDLHAISGGLGYVHSRFSIDFGLMHEVVDDGRMVIMLGAKYFAN